MRRRFEREAIALQHIMPEVQLGLNDVVRYFFSAVFLDLGAALRGLMRGTILELRTSNLRRTAKLLREAIPSASIGLFGDRLHLVTDDQEKDREIATNILAKEGIELSGIRQIEPSLEDVFVSVLSREQT